MRITAAQSTDLFTGSPDRPLQVVRVTRGRAGRHSGPCCGSRVTSSSYAEPVEVPPGMAKRSWSRSPSRSIRRRVLARRLPPRWCSKPSGRATSSRPCGRRAGLDSVHDSPLPLRPGVVEHPGRLYRDLGQGRLGMGGGVPIARLPSGRRSPRCRPPRSRLRLRSGRARLPQALLGRPSRGSRLHQTAARRGTSGIGGRHLQRAQHQPHRLRDHDPQSGLRRRLPARRDGWRPCHGLAARRLRARPAVSWSGRLRRAHLELVGTRAVSCLGAVPDADDPRAGPVGDPVG